MGCPASRTRHDAGSYGVKVRPGVILGLAALIAAAPLPASVLSRPPAAAIGVVLGGMLFNFGLPLLMAHFITRRTAAPEGRFPVIALAVVSLIAALQIAGAAKAGRPQLWQCVTGECGQNDGSYTPSSAAADPFGGSTRPRVMAASWSWSA